MIHLALDSHHGMAGVRGESMGRLERREGEDEVQFARKRGDVTVTCDGCIFRWKGGKRSDVVDTSTTRTAAEARFFAGQKLDAAISALSTSPAVGPPPREGGGGYGPNVPQMLIEHDV